MTIRSGLRVLGIDKAAARVTINGEVVKVGGGSVTRWGGGAAGKGSHVMWNRPRPCPPALSSSRQLLGFNRHTMWLDTGASVTPEQEAADLAILQGLNATYVRCV